MSGVTDWPGLHSPRLVPRVVLAAGATLLALVAPLAWVPFLAVGAGVALGRARASDDARGGLRAAGWMGVAILVVTLGVTPFWLVWLAGVPHSQAILVAGSLAVRLSAVFFVGYAFSCVVRPSMWFVSLRRFPRLALVLALTFRQLPESAEDARRLRAAQQARGLLLGRRRWRPLVFLVPLFSRAVERAERLSTALVLSGWGTGRPVPVRTLTWSPPDAAYLGGGILLVALAALAYLL